MPSISDYGMSLRLQLRRSAPGQTTTEAGGYFSAFKRGPAVPTTTEFERYFSAFRRGIDSSIRMYEDALNGLNHLAADDARRYPKIFFSLEGQKDARDQIIALLSALPADTEVNVAVQKVSNLMDQLKEATDSAVAHYEKTNASEDVIKNALNMQLGYFIAAGYARKGFTATN